MSGSTERYDLNPKCPAKSTECCKCEKMNHLEKICRTGDTGSRIGPRPEHRDTKVSQINKGVDNSDDLN